MNAPAPSLPERWTVILPVKALASAKTRLAPDGGETVPDLALAFFQDTATAALSCSAVTRVVVATSDHQVSAWANAATCTVVDDSDARGINEAAAHAVAALALGGPIAVLVGDLPCLTPEALDHVLAAGRMHAQSFLADLDGTGTTTWMCTDGFVTPHFGAESRAAHRAAGAVDLALGADQPAWLPARRDIDTVEDLAAARALGLGAHTAAALLRRDLPRA